MSVYSRTYKAITKVAWSLAPQLILSVIVAVLSFLGGVGYSLSNYPALDTRVKALEVNTTSINSDIGVIKTQVQDIHDYFLVKK